LNITKQLRETLALLLQSVPSGLSIEKVEPEIVKIPGVMGIHHPHIWTHDGDHHGLSSHVVSDPDSSIRDSSMLRKSIRSHLLDWVFLMQRLRWSPLRAGIVPKLALAPSCSASHPVHVHFAVPNEVAWCELWQCCFFECSSLETSDAKIL